MKEFDKDLMTVYRYFQHTWDTNSIMYTKLSKNFLSMKVYRITDSTRFHIFFFMKSLHACMYIGSSEKGFEKQLNFLDVYTSQFFFDTFFFFFNFIAPLGIIDFFFSLLPIDLICASYTQHEYIFFFVIPKCFMCYFIFLENTKKW